MSLLRLQEVYKHYGAHPVLVGANLQIDPGEKVGLVGRNGGGKTTLLRLIEGSEKPDEGQVIPRRGLRLGHVPQHPEFSPGVTVRAHVEGGMVEAQGVARQLEELTERMASQDGSELDRAIREHEELSERLQRLGGYEIERRVETVLSGIGLDPALWEREARVLSGGEKSRTALARELVAGHELLLLDEPTNHLDLAGIEWIEGWLASMPGAVLIVSHDRRLLERAVDAIADLERGSIQRYPGNYSKYLTLRQERYETELRAWQNQQTTIAREETFIRKHMASQRTAEAKGRRRRLERLERLAKPHNDVRRPVIRAPSAARGGELVLEARGLAAGYDEKRLFEGVDLRIGRAQRIGIVGPNGCGKSTLLKVLSGNMPALAGTLERGHREACGYYDQESASLASEGTPLEELRRDHPQATELELRDHLARFLFRGAEVEKPNAALSGGERARLALAKLTWTQPSWLAMDEPTNHLDLAARTALEEMLGEFTGALVCVSHDRAFLDGLCTTTVAIEDGQLHVFDGNYSAWRASRDDELAAQEVRDTTKPKREPKPAKQSETAAGKIRNPFKFAQLEERIMALEEELAELHERATEERVYHDAELMKETQARIEELEADLASANEEWENWV